MNVMERLWIQNTVDERRAMIEQAVLAHKGIAQQAVEKDWWVTVILRALFRCGCAGSLMFKGGTSLSKAWGVIDRFSEDIDLAISHSFFGIDKTTRSQKEKLRKRDPELGIYIGTNCPQVQIVLRYKLSSGTNDNPYRQEAKNPVS